MLITPWPNLLQNALGVPIVQQCGTATSAPHDPAIATQIQETERTLLVDVVDAMSGMAVGTGRDHENGGGREAAPRREVGARSEGHSEVDETGGRKRGVEAEVEAEVKVATDTELGEVRSFFFLYTTPCQGNSYTR